MHVRLFWALGPIGSAQRREPWRTDQETALWTESTSAPRAQAHRRQLGGGERRAVVSVDRAEPPGGVGTGDHLALPGRAERDDVVVAPPDEVPPHHDLLASGSPPSSTTRASDSARSVRLLRPGERYAR